MQSLQYRLGVLLGVLLITIIALHVTLMGYFPRHLAEDRVLNRLKHDSETLAERLIVEPGLPLKLAGNYISPIYLEPFSGHYFRIQSKDSLLLSRSLQDQDFVPPPITSKKTVVSHMIGPKDQSILVWTRKIDKHGQAITLSTAEDITDITEDISKLRKIYLLVTILTVLVLIALQTLIIRKTLEPVQQVRRELLDIGQGKEVEIKQKVPSEIQPLVDEINYLFSKMQRRIERSRHATGNLAHALKTPLSVLTQLEDSPELTKHPELREEIIQTCQQMEQAIKRELKRSRLAGSYLPGQQFQLNKELPDLVVLLEKVYADKALTIRLNIPDNTIFQGDREDMLELLGNLLDNACKWARHKVVLRVTDDIEVLHLVIEDDGKGVEPEQLKSMVQRGERFDESTPGDGLGLSIVNEIVKQYQGKIKFTTSKNLGGLQVELSL